MSDNKSMQQSIDELNQWVSQFGNADVNSVRTVLDRSGLKRLSSELADNVYVLCQHALQYPVSSAYCEPYTMDEAAILGNAVRATKLYVGLAMLEKHNFQELSVVFARLISETITTMLYIMKHPDVSTNYRLVSHQSNASELRRLRKHDKEGKPDEMNEEQYKKYLNQRKKLYAHIEKELNSDGLSEKDILDNEEWKLDGKCYGRLYRDVFGKNDEYVFFFENMSNHVHGTWKDILKYHVKKDKDTRFSPNLSWHQSNMGLSRVMSMILLDAIDKFFIGHAALPKEAKESFHNMAIHMILIAASLDELANE